MTPRSQKLASPDHLWPWVVRAHRHANLLCAAIVAIGISLWWLWSESGALRHPERLPSPTRLTWLASRPVDVASAWRSDLRAVSSPVLFALPTPLGFSRDALVPSGRKPPPPIRLPSAIEPLHSVPTDTIAQLGRSSLLDQVAMNRALAWPVSDATNVPAAAGRAKAEVILVCTRAEAPTETRTIALGTNQTVLLDQPWDAVARVSLDAGGWIERILLEKPTASSNRNAALVRLLRGLNFGPRGAPECRLALRFEGADAGVGP